MKKLLFVLVATVLILGQAGCREQQRKKSVEPIKQTDITLDCTAKFLCSDESPLGDGLRHWYLTEQKQEVFIEPKAMTVTAKEPFGKIVLALNNGRFAIQKKPRVKIFDEELFNLMTDESIYKGLLELYIAELKGPRSAAIQAAGVKFEGQLYDLVWRGKNGIEIYKNKSTRRNDLVISQGKKRYVLFGYDYLKVSKDGHFPSKIDIYAYKDGSDRQLVAQYSCRLP